MSNMVPARSPLHFRLGFGVCIFAVSLLGAHVTDASAQDSSDLQQQLEQLQLQLIEVQRESQARLQALQQETAARISFIEEQIVLIQANTSGKAGSGTSEPVGSPATAAVAEDTATGVTATPSAPDRLHLSGDSRLRYESNSSDGSLGSWDRWVLRGRLGATYDLAENLTIGARLVTGDPENPRTTDVTISDFANDLDISLDQAYFAYQRPGLMLTGGKFAKPFSSTELVWDGDVNPQGLGGYYDLVQEDRWSLRFSGLYFVINENTLAQSSDMLGGQLSLGIKPAAEWEASLHLSYFDYDMGLLDPLVPGGARGNTVTADRTRYVSDFNLLDASGTLGYRGFGDRWKVWLTADYVKNLGAEIPQDAGFGADLFAGSLSHKGHWLLRYGYAQAGTDAVLGLYSHDNIVYPTNYRMHTLSADYALSDHAFVGLTNYFYKQLDPDPLSPHENDWVSRTRLNLYFIY